MEVSYDKIIELIEMGFLSLAIFSLSIIKLLSFCDKKKTNKEQLDLLRAQSEFNNRIESYNRNVDISSYNRDLNIANHNKSIAIADYTTSCTESDNNSI